MTLFYRRFPEEWELIYRLDTEQVDADYWFSDPFGEGEEPMLGYVDSSLFDGFCNNDNLLSFGGRFYAMLNIDICRSETNDDKTRHFMCYYLCGRYGRKARLYLWEYDALKLQNGESIVRNPQ